MGLSRVYNCLVLHWNISLGRQISSLEIMTNYDYFDFKYSGMLTCLFLNISRLKSIISLDVYL